MKTLKDIFFWAGTILASVFFGLFTFASFSEWWLVKVEKHTRGYAWGPVNENEWYYANPNVYSTVMLIDGIIFTMALIILLRQIIKKDKTKILYALMACSALFILMMIMGEF